MYHVEFQWDELKAKANLLKHDVAFTDAAKALGDAEYDKYHIDRLDDRHTEDRWLTLASDPADRGIIYVIVWTEVSEDELEQSPVTRIISARLATATERKLYAQRNKR